MHARTASDSSPMRVPFTTHHPPNDSTQSSTCTQVARDSSSDVFGEGKGGLEVVGELVERAQAEGGKWEEVVEGIKERELQVK